MERVMPWGLKLPFVYNVPRIVPGTNKLTILRNIRTGKPFVKRDERADGFRDHLKAGTLQLLSAMRSQVPQLSGVAFPLLGAYCQIRVDVLLAFSQAGNGPGRMKTADLDNLKKMIFDALAGILIDDDRWITEGFAAKGLATEAEPNDRVALIVSRAGFRDSRALDWLAMNLPILPPWRPENQGKILLAHPGDVKKIN